jgi:hypothetical protein
MRMKNAARLEPKAAVNAIQHSPYRSPRTLSKTFRKIPRQPDIRKPKTRIRGCSTGLRDSVALLVLGLQRDDLPLRQQRRGWALVERWLGQFVEARLMQGGTRC